jgi:hypothetical protein
MGLASLQADIVDRRSQNGARLIFEDQYPHGHSKPNLQGDSTLTAAAEALGMTPAKLIALRKWVTRVTKECNERLSREMTLVYTLNEQRTRVLAVKYMPKGEAAEMAKVVPGGELLDLDHLYGGMLVRCGYVFVSEALLREGLRKYAPPALLNGLIEERRAA